MRRVILGFVLLTSAVLGQTTPSFDGKWEMRVVGDNGPDVIVLKLDVVSDAMTGTMTRSNPSGQRPVPIKDLWIAVDEIRFTVTSPDGLRTVHFSGKISGNEIAFKREAQGREGGSGIYGLKGPATLVAKRSK